MWTAYRHGHPRSPAVEFLMNSITRSRTPKDVHIAWTTRRFYRREMRDAIFATGWDGTVKIRATADESFRVTVER